MVRIAAEQHTTKPAEKHAYTGILVHRVRNPAEHEASRKNKTTSGVLAHRVRNPIQKTKVSEQRKQSTSIGQIALVVRNPAKRLPNKGL